MILENKLIKGKSKDTEYSYGPKVSIKTFNKCQMINLKITEFLSPTLFFAFEDLIDYDLDYKLNLFYDSLNEFFLFDYLPKVGSICVVRSQSDSRWYRAKVLSCNFQFKSVDLYLLDYGYIERNARLKYIRKLESTFSTQFSTYLNDNLKNQSQAALFGLTCVKPTSYGYYDDDNSLLKSLTDGENFYFQVVDLPGFHSDVKSESINSIPLVLLRSDPFTKASTNLSSYLIRKLNWEECSFNDSLDVIIQSLYKIDYDTFNVHIMIPYQLKIYQRSKNQEKVLHSSDNLVKSQQNDHINGDQDTDDINDDLDNLSDRSANDLSDVDDCNKISTDILKLDLSVENDDDNDKELISKSNSLKSQSDVESDEKSIKTEIDDKDAENYCSIASWKMSSTIVKSNIKDLQWHLPLPDERVFRALVTGIDDKLGFHINVCSEDIIKSFRILEKSLEKHFLLCNDSMLRQFMSEIDLSLSKVCLVMNNSTYNRAEIISERSIEGKYQCKLLDYGYNITVDHCDIIAISDQFCNLPPLAVKCFLSGFGIMVSNIDILVERFKELLEECDYQVLITLCFMDKRGSFNRIDDKIIINQPMPVELFFSRTEQNGESKIVSVNVILNELNEEYIKINEDEGTEPVSLSKDELYLCSEKIDEVEEIDDDYDDDDDLDCHLNLDEYDEKNEDEKEKIDGMNDIYLTQQILDQNELPHIHDKKPVCEYFRKGRCFKGKRCEDRHVMDSDCSDDDDNEEKFKWVESACYLNRSFERQLRKGSTIGLRVTAIYNNGIFYAYLTHGINGFDTDNFEAFESDTDSSSDDAHHNNDDNNIRNTGKHENDSENGLDFLSIQEMEDNLNDFMKYKFSTFKEEDNLPINTLVAVSFEEKIRRGSITNLVDYNRYQVFLVDYGISIEVHLENLFLLPKQYITKFKQQCFMCKLSGVCVSESDSVAFSDWFFDRVNRRILHAKVIDTDDEGMNFVELYDFISDSCNPSINSLVYKALNF